MKNPQRGQSILQWRDSSRLEQTGQNWFGNSGVGLWLAGFDVSLLISRYPLQEGAGPLLPWDRFIPQA